MTSQGNSGVPPPPPPGMGPPSRQGNSGVPPPAPGVTSTSRKETAWPGFVAFAKSRWGFLVIGLLIGAAVGAGSATATNGEGNDRSALAASPAETQGPTSAPTAELSSPSPEESTSLPAIPNPDAKFSSACDYILGDFSNFTTHGFRFIASATIHNTGNIGVVADVKARWVQLGTKPLTDVKTVRIPVGASKHVNFTKPVGQDNIDLIQSAQGSGDICGVKVALTDTFGEPQ
jgi:hypothetical protein